MKYSLESAFSLFGMALVIMGIAGDRRVKLGIIEVGPLGKGWRVVATGLGMLVLFGIGAMVYLSEVTAP